MTTKKRTMVTKDMANKKLFTVREFDAPREKVWEYWTKSSLLDLWWAPKPWKAMTKSMDFREGGLWFYCMAGPEGEQHCARLDYLTIDPGNSFTAQDSFCDEAGNKNADFSDVHWANRFYTTPTGTRVEVEMTFKDEADIAKILEMGFEGGFTMAHGNLDELLAK